LLTNKVFARKLVRLFGNVSRQDIENEARVVGNLCTAGSSRYVVEVFNHGWLQRNPSYYFTDMEFCPETLEDRISVSRPLIGSYPEAAAWDDIVEIVDIGIGFHGFHDNNEGTSPFRDS
jgi:hypothetical protein